MPTSVETMSRVGEKAGEPCQVDATRTPSLPRFFLSVLVAMRVCMAGFLFMSAGPVRAAEEATEPLSIVTASGPHKFAVEVMHTDAQRERGLMFRRFLPQDRGMLFDFKTVRPVMMWMKNTYIPLDMIFIARSGRVTGIAANAEPLSERIIPSGAPVFAVLEVNAGTAAKIKLKIGDRVRNSLFAP